MTYTNFPNGFNGGVTIYDMPVWQSFSGNVIWVDANSALAGQGTFKRPHTTLEAALAQATASKGDIILIKPYHTETITGVAGISIAKAGVTVRGLGTGAARPTFLMDAAATVTASISAADVTLENVVLSAGFADIVAGITVTASGVSIINVEFIENVAAENFLTEIKATSTTDNNADNLRVIGCRAISVDAAGLEFLEINGDLDSLVFTDNFVSKDAATGGVGILCATGKDLTNCQILRNQIVSGATAGAILVNSNTTANSGIVAHNLIGHHDTAAAAPIDVTGARVFENYAVGVDDASALLLPAVDDNA